MIFISRFSHEVQGEFEGLSKLMLQHLINIGILLLKIVQRHGREKLKEKHRLSVKYKS